MADSDTYYVNIDGKTISPSSILAEMIEVLREKLENGDTRLTDVNEGSEVRNLLETMAYSMYRYCYENEKLAKQSLLKYAEGDWLDDIGYMVGLTRKGSVQAYGDVRFTIAVPLDTDYTIPDGITILSRTTGLSYTLNAPNGYIEIKAGETQCTGQVIAEDGGSAYNADAHTLTVFDSGITLRHDLSVTNDYAFTTGVSYEDDASFRKRILKKLQGDTFGSRSYYESLVLDISGVRAVNIVPPTTLNNNDGVRHLCNGVVCNSCHDVVVVDVADSQTTETKTILENVTNVVTDQSNIVLGHKFHVQECVHEPYYFKINYYQEDGEDEVTQKEIKECLSILFKGGTYEGIATKEYYGFDIGETINKSILIDALENMTSIKHVESIKLLCPYYNLSYIKNNALKTWYKDNKFTTETYTQSNGILNFPDIDDDGIDISTCDVPVWNIINTQAGVITSDNTIYELCVDGYYFYKYKLDKDLSNDNNNNETSINGDDDPYFNWGEKQFTEINVYEDSVITLGEIGAIDPITGNSKDNADGTFVILNKLN